MKVYLDTCIFDLIIDFGENQKSSHSVAFEKIWIYPSVSFWVSPVKSLEEINNIKDNGKRDKCLEIFKKLNKTPPTPSSSYGSFVRFNRPSTQDLDLTKLIKLLYSGSEYYPKRTLSVIQNDKGKQITNDVFHIYYAWKGKCDYFLTVDYKLIKKCENLKIKFDSIISPMKIVNPPALLGDI